MPSTYTGNPWPVAEEITLNPNSLTDYRDHILRVGPIDKHQALYLLGEDWQGEEVQIDLGLSTHCMNPNCCDLAEAYWFVEGFGWIIREDTTELLGEPTPPPTTFIEGVLL